MSISAVREAFVSAGNGTLTCTQARLRYGEGNTQILEFDGVDVDGNSFALVSDPFDAGANPQVKAREMAAGLLAASAEQM